MARQYTEWEVEECILASQTRRADERRASPDWELVDENEPGLEWLGPTWRKVTPVITTLDECERRAAAFHTTHNGPVPTACRAVEQLRDALEPLTVAERADVLVLLRDEIPDAADCGFTLSA